MRILISATLLLSGVSAVRVGDDEPKKYQSPDNVTSPESVHALLETKQAGNADKHTIGYRVTMKRAGHGVEADSNAAAAAKEAESEDAEGWPNPVKSAAKAVKAGAKKVASAFGFGGKKDPQEYLFWNHTDVRHTACVKFIWSFKCDDDNARKGWVDMGYVPESSDDYKKCGPNKDEHCSWCCPPPHENVNPPEDAKEDENEVDGSASTTPKDNDGWGLNLPKFNMPDWGGGMPDFKFPGLPEGQKINDPKFPGFDINLPVIEMPNLPGFPGFDPSLPETPGGPKIPTIGGGGKTPAKKEVEDQQKKVDECQKDFDALDKKYEDCKKKREEGNAIVSWVQNLVDPCKENAAAREAAKDRCDAEKKDLERKKKNAAEEGDCGAKPPTGGVPATNFDTSKDTKDIIAKLKDEAVNNPVNGGITLNGISIAAPGQGPGGVPTPVGPGGVPIEPANSVPHEPTDGMDAAKKKIYDETKEEAMEKGMTEKQAKDIAKKATDALNPVQGCGQKK